MTYKINVKAKASNVKEVTFKYGNQIKITYYSSYSR